MRRTLLAVLVIALVPVAGGVATADGGGGSYQQVVDVTFPVSGNVRYGDDYHQNRGGGTRRHQATDIMGTKLQRLHAAVDGKVCYINGIQEPMPDWGYSLTICGDDGRSYRYVHVNNDNPGTDDGAGGPGWAYAPGISKGVRVVRGQWVAYMGDSGNAEGTAPHLHFEIVDPDLDDPALAVAPYKPDRVNPFPSLQEARRRGDVPTEAGTPAPVISSVRRVAGGHRVATAVALSKERASARSVIVVPAGSHVEALVAAPLAGLIGAPVLLSSPRGLDAEVAAEVRRLGARNAYVIGRTDQLAATVEADLAAAGVTAHARLSAPDPAALSAAVAREMASYPSVGGRFTRVFLAVGEANDPSRAWPDALSASALAAKVRQPILLTRPGTLPPAVAEVLAELRPGTVTVVGGTEAIAANVAEAAALRAGSGPAERLAGANRYGTSVAVAVAARTAGLTSSRAWLATGRNFPDALAAGPAAARAGAPLLLVDGTTTGGSPETDAHLSGQRSALDGAVVVGGSAAVSDEVTTAVHRLIE